MMKIIFKNLFCLIKIVFFHSIALLYSIQKFNDANKVIVPIKALI